MNPPACTHRNRRLNHHVQVVLSGRSNLLHGLGERNHVGVTCWS